MNDARTDRPSAQVLNDRRLPITDVTAKHAYQSDAASVRPTQTQSADPSHYRAIAKAKRKQGDELAALAHLIAANALEVRDGERHADATAELCDVATGYLMKGDLASAEHWYKLVSMIDPRLAVPYQNLAVIYARTGRSVEAWISRERAYQLQRVFVEGARAPSVERAGAARRRVLILCSGRTSGNVPFENLMPAETCHRIKYAIDYAADDEDRQLPAYDVVFNAIGEPDVAAPLADRLERFVQRCDRPVLNAPSSVGRTQRHTLAALLGDIDDVVIAPCMRWDPPYETRLTLGDRLCASGITFPVLLRPATTHGGEGLERCATREWLERRTRDLIGVHYLTQFRDYRSADRQYRKYRIIFVDRRPFPYHLAISAHWMVHYFSAAMETNACKIDEERRFLDDPHATLGDRAMTALAAIGRRLDLDYGGVDFSLLADGRILVFEANATMLVHRERNDGVLTHKNAYVQRIVDAFEQMLVRRTTAPACDAAIAGV
jgi:hypothetical protein